MSIQQPRAFRRRAHPRKTRSIATLFTIALLSVAVTAGCSSKSSSTTGGSTTGGSTGGGSTGGGSTSGGSCKKVNIAMFLVADANTHQQAALSGAKAAAAATCGVSIHEFGANFDPTTQTNQVQTAIASGQYNALLIDSVDGTVMTPAITKAIGAGIKVVCGFSICGPDQLKFAKEIPGVTAQISSDFQVVGKANADALGAACAKLNPCNTVYMDGIPALGANQTFKKGFDTEVAKYPNIKIVATGLGQYSSAKAFTAMKDILQAHPNVNAVASPSDQEITGAVQALAESPLASKHVILVGDGASELAKKGIVSGVWYASAILRPNHEGLLEANAAIDAVRGKPVKALVNSSLTPAYPNGYIGPADAAKWKPEWAG